jgi:hypothetical protein
VWCSLSLDSQWYKLSYSAWQLVVTLRASTWPMWIMRWTSRQIVCQ